MLKNITAFWHKESFERLMRERLPKLLADRLPLASYHFESTGRYTCRLKIFLGSASDNVEEYTDIPHVEYPDIPQPDEEGIFEIDGGHRVVVPTASHDDLGIAEIKCVGEQLYDYFEARLGEAPPNLRWNVSLARTWFPLDKWMRDFLRYELTAQTLQEHNWLDKHCHLRRISLLKWDRSYKPGHFGRVCPFETPEGPSLGRILSLAVGTEIHDRRLVIVDKRPEAALGLTATMVPFVEHNDPNRQLMGVNMMRQWEVPPDPQPALVQTGNEPEAPEFWCGRNVLTAFVSWGVDTFGDAIVISESCAKRFNYPYPVEAGDKFSNRHGTKGVISRILPDDEMPHLSDGTPVELVFSFIGLHTRLNFGQLREAIMSRLARVEGKPAIVPAFQAPAEAELRERLKKAGLPEAGMEILTIGKNGKKLQRPSTVGWVYLGCLHHIARDKIKASVKDRSQCQKLGEAEYEVLRNRNLSAFENIREWFNTCSAERDDADKLADRLAAGAIEPAGPPTPMFSNLVRRLAIAGIYAELDGERVTFRFEPPKGKVLKLARPVKHPWLRNQMLDEVGVFEELPEYQALDEVNSRVKRMFESQAPDSLSHQTLSQLQAYVGRYFEALINPAQLCFNTRTLFSGRAVIEPDINLRVDQVGIPEQIAWTLFGPIVARELGNAEEAIAKSQRATQLLDEIMARSWVILYRAPVTSSTSFLAFHPVRQSDNSVHLDPMVCNLLNADFDGDQVAVFLPITKGAQREAGERLSVAGHLTRDPELLGALLPTNEAMWGLANLSLKPEGRQEIATLAGVEVAAPDGFVTKRSLADAMRVVLKRDGVDKTLENLEKLMQRGFELAKESGASMSPFIGASLERFPLPEGDEVEAWNAYAEEVSNQIVSRKDFNDNDLGPQILAIKIGAKGRLDALSQLVVRWNSYLNLSLPVVRHGYRDGLTSDELRAIIPYHWEGLAQFSRQWEQLNLNPGPSGVGLGSFNVMARAMRSKRPGIVFARAAATGEADPLTDIDSRLFVGLPVT